ncbi:hypothetical protein HII31_07604 [Pseudocercospora fuligena]|uniref:MOSC domain-containing protein n=1 Tax=Pseudocercospora fuligena TaxID=685502 RepID=A0A8H6RHH8_9PEZI|nr:hypothetical protein HII31_07604 [Pseudocercospora fuligena]
MFEHFVEHIKELLQNPRFWDGKVDKSGLLLIAVVIGVVSIGLYANMGNTVDLTKDKLNAAIATGQGVVDSKNRPPIPPPSEVISLRIYPIKSCRGIEIDSTRLKKSGLTLDRNWMFISQSDKKFLTIRGDPSMTLIDTNIIEGTDTFKGQQMLEISIHGTDGRVVIPAFPSEKWLSENTALETVNIWDQDTDGYIYSDEINSIFSEFFSKPVALVYKGPTSRMVAINGRKELYGQEIPHHFADVMSLQIASEASIKDLNTRLNLPSDTEEALTIERFRPNIIIKGRDSHPWEEDTWKRIRINTSIPAEEALYKIDLDVVARCARCQVPNVNPDTAEKNPKQPWDTLMKFRRVDDGGPARWKPCFGMMCIPKSEGKIAVGAKLEVLETTDQHLYNVRRFEEL